MSFAGVRAGNSSRMRVTLGDLLLAGILVCQIILVIHFTT